MQLLFISPFSLCYDFLLSNKFVATWKKHETSQQNKRDIGKLIEQLFITVNFKVSHIQLLYMTDFKIGTP